LSDSFTSHVSGAQPIVHAGAGPQYNFPIALASRAGRSPRKQAADELAWLERRFIPPSGFARARALLQSHRTVFLDAPPGSGRIAAAKMLLWELGPDAEQFHELLPRDMESEPSLNLAHIGDGDRMWLDLSDVGGLLWDEIHAELSSLRAVVQERAARLVLVLPHGVEDLRPEFEQYRAEIGRPPTQEVLRRHLRIEGFSLPEPDRRIEFLRENRPLRDVPKYVRLVAEARDKSPVRDDFAKWCDAADRALSGQEHEVAQLVADVKLGSQRALLLATAMLHGAHADVVQRASASMLQVVGHPPDECPVLERTTLDRRLGEIHAELDADGNVRFKQLDYDSAVRSYFWTQMPEIHDHMRDWVGRTADSSDLTDSERENLVGRFAEQCLSDRYLSMLVSLVEEWTNKEATSRQANRAALILQCGLSDERHGRAFRRQIYDWSRKSLPDLLAEVVIVACRDQMAVTHPDEALVRLHHVARHEYGRGTRARDALVELASGDRRFLSQLLGRLADLNPERKIWDADVALFLDLADPDALTDPSRHGPALITGRVMRRQLIDGWRLAFSEVSHDTWSPRAQHWLRRAAEDGRYRHQVLDVLVEGAERRTSILAYLYAMTRQKELRTTVSDLLLQKINAVLEIRIV
jgi:hypothetical protein